MRKRIAGIPTIGARNIQYRSRLEAQWSYLFNRMNIVFEYEPFDLIDYVPDFVLTTKDGSPMLVEVKGTVCIDDLYQYVDKIFKSGWQGNYLLVGACVWPSTTMSDSLVDNDEVAVIGIMGTTVGDNSRVPYKFDNNGHFDEPIIHEAMVVHDIGGCNIVSKSSVTTETVMIGTDVINDMFSDCKNIVQWKAGKVCKPSATTKKGRLIRYDCRRCSDTGIMYCCDNKYGPCMCCDIAKTLNYIEHDSECNVVITTLGKSMIEHYE